jgi:hypothetical protein
MACVSSVEKLKRALINNCKPVGQGLKEQIYVGTRDQIAGYVTDPTNPKIITGITMKASEKLKLWEGFNLSSQATVGFAANDNGNNITHGLRFMVYDNSPEADAEVDLITRRTDIFAIVKQQGEFGRWKALGWTTGLKATNLTYDSNEASTPGQFILEFSAAQEKETPKTVRHATDVLEDTESYLITLALVANV